MEIKELKKLKIELQTAMSMEISKLVEEFKEKTKISPSRISVDMLSVSDMGHAPESIVGKVVVDIEI